MIQNCLMTKIAINGKTIRRQMEVFHSHPLVVYHPYTWKHYSQYNNNKSPEIHIKICKGPRFVSPPVDSEKLKMVNPVILWLTIVTNKRQNIIE